MNLTAILFAGWVFGAIAFAIVPRRSVRWKLIGIATRRACWRLSLPCQALPTNYFLQPQTRVPEKQGAPPTLHLQGAGNTANCSLQNIVVFEL
jgi:hypothetical protein